ncbi:hypothetical protein [Subtercola lobariae]|uniref:Uncharacterized protein n=1 Tax=Subtercola lobariae TaxID=1588641 RepID=A0A917B9Z7_9MICO|nr:hypothetical protein [Subtercola lobariae]GGF30071.1 hypothetical protein GCM10011399_24050 [Subtercola lobariae]
MKVILSSVSKGENGENLPATSLSYESGAVTLAVVETAKRPTVLALMAAGRMVPDAGTITFDDRTDPAALRERSAIVDAPDVSEPVDDLKLTAVVQEELMFAERSNSRRDALNALDELDAGQYAGYEMQNVPPVVRLRILAELAVSRPGIEAVVLTSPDRHGGDPLGWWAVAADLAERGLAVLVIASEASIDAVREIASRFETDRLAELERQAAARRREEAEAAAAANAAADAQDEHPHPHAVPLAHPDNAVIGAGSPPTSTSTAPSTTHTPAHTTPAPPKDHA